MNYDNAIFDNYSIYSVHENQVKDFDIGWRAGQTAEWLVRH